MTITQPITTLRMPASLSNNGRALSQKRLWSGRLLTGLAGAFLLFDASLKLLKPPFVVEATVRVGYPESTIVGIGVVLLVCTLLYLIPRTSIFGALLLTGYLGGAVASGVRAGTPGFDIVFPVLFAAVVWASLVLRDSRLGSVLFKCE